MRGWIRSRYSSINPRRINERASSPLPSSPRSSSASSFREATASTASPSSRVEFCQGRGSVSVRDATYFRAALRASL